MLLDIDADPLYKSAAFQRIVSCQADLPRKRTQDTRVAGDPGLTTYQWAGDQLDRDHVGREAIAERHLLTVLLFARVSPTAKRCLTKS